MKWVDNCQDRTGNTMIHVVSDAKTCQRCTVRALCTRSEQSGRNRQLWPREQHEAIQRLRTEQLTNEFRERLKPRMEIEGTISQAVRAFGTRHTRYVGLAKTHLQYVAIVAAIDLCRFWDYLCGATPVHSRTSPFAALAG